jgi:hypothetical protein
MYAIDMKRRRQHREGINNVKEGILRETLSLIKKGPVVEGHRWRQKEVYARGSDDEK